MKKNDDLKYWLQENKDALLFDELVSQPLVAEVTELGYGPCLTDVEIEKIGGAGDPFLIAYARVDPEHRCVVTNEHPKPKRTGANRHIPDVCKDLGVECIDTIKLIRMLDFRTQDFRTSL